MRTLDQLNDEIVNDAYLLHMGDCDTIIPMHLTEEEYDLLNDNRQISMTEWVAEGIIKARHLNGCKLIIRTIQ